MAQEQHTHRNSQEERSHVQGEERRPRGAIPRPMSGMAAVRRYPKSKDRSSGREEIPHIQGKETQLHFSGEAVKRYCTSKVRETQVRW